MAATTEYSLVLVYYHVIQIRSSTFPRGLAELRQQFLAEFARFLVGFTEEQFTFIGHDGPRRVPIRTDADLGVFLNSLQYTRTPSFEGDISRPIGQQLFNGLLQQLQGRESDMKVLQQEMNDLRAQGYGGMQAYPLLVRTAQVPDEKVVQVVQQFGQGGIPVVTAMQNAIQDPSYLEQAAFAQLSLSHIPVSSN
jgi:hypothetical protein